MLTILKYILQIILGNGVTCANGTDFDTPGECKIFFSLFMKQYFSGINSL